VRFLGAQDGKFVFRLAKPEQQLLMAMLKLYPCIPPAHHQLTKSGKPRGDDPNQRLLDEALFEQRQENKKLIQAFVNDSERIVETEKGFRMILSATDLEWLLQVLNDVRVGNWVLLGSPEDGAPGVDVNEKTAPHIWALEVSGHFQIRLLEALRAGQTT